MALFAKDGTTITRAVDAQKNKTFSCLSCSRAVKLKKGFFRSAHFYHIDRSFCRDYGKSARHLLIQIELQKLLLPYETILEKAFPSIQRIADVVWEKQKMIFEIQCSSITEKEVQQREQDYQSLGYSVIWILDDQFFNQYKLKPTEFFLRSRSSYFAHFKKNLLLYDQFEAMTNRYRKWKGRKMLVSPQNIVKDLPKGFLSTLPSFLHIRRTTSSIFLKDDAILQALFQTTYFIRIADRLSQKKISSPLMRLYRKVFKKFLGWFESYH